MLWTLLSGQVLLIDTHLALVLSRQFQLVIDSTRNQLFRQFQLTIYRQFAQWSGQIRLTDRVSKSIVRTNPISGQSLKSIIWTFSIIRQSGGVHRTRVPNFRVLNLKKTAWTLDAYQNCGGKREPACKEADYLVPGINIDRNWNRAGKWFRTVYWLDFIRNWETSAVSTPDGCLKLNFASCVMYIRWFVLTNHFRDCLQLELPEQFFFGDYQLELCNQLMPDAFW